MGQTMIYKVSYVVMDGRHPGAILSTEVEPKVGDEVAFDGRLFAVREVIELVPPLGDFCFLHVTCQYLRDLPARSDAGASES